MVRQLPPFDGLVSGVGGLPWALEDSWRFVMQTSPELPYVPEPPDRSLFSSLLPFLPSGSREILGGGIVLPNHTLPPPAESLAPHKPALPLPRSFALDTQRARTVAAHIVGPWTAASYLFVDDVSWLETPEHLESFFHWYAELLRQVVRSVGHLSAPLLLVLDEPALPAEGEWGSAIRSAAAAIHDAGAFAGLHCCQTAGWSGRWPAILEAGFDAVSVPAASLLVTDLARELLRTALLNGLNFLLGVVDPVPSGEPPPDWRAIGRHLDLPSSVLRSRCAFTPTCGMSRITPERAFQTVHEVASIAGSVRSSDA